MESFEFLGGRYNRPEQIMSGPVQAFRAQSAANGRIVFIHRVSTTESPEEQASLLKLLTTALVKSADTKRLVLDFGEESGYWYVVTESEPQCALLREWLQLEIEAAAAHSHLGTSAPPATKTPASPAPPASDTGEFTRFLKGRPSLDATPPAPTLTTQTASGAAPVTPPTPPRNEDEPGVGEFTRIFQSPKTASPAISVPPTSAPSQPAPPTPPAVQRPAPSEFTSLFNATDSENKQKQFSSGPTPQRPIIAEPPVNTPPPGTGQQEGEFTRFFKPGLPPVPPKPAAGAPQSPNAERTQNKPFVQRPNTPVPPLGAAASNPPDKGEFTQFFSRSDKAKPPASAPAGNFQPPEPVRNDPLGFTAQQSGQANDLSDDLFNDRIDIPRPSPSSQPKASEFTMMFGSSGSAAPPIQQPGVVAPPRDKSPLSEPANEDPLQSTRQLPTAKPTAPPAGEQPPANAPSEFTMIMQGGYGPAKPAANAGTPSTGGSAPPKSTPGLPPLNLNIAPVNPAGALPHMGGAAGSTGSVHGSVSQSGVAGGSPLGSASMAAPRVPPPQIPPANVQIPTGGAKGANKKLLIFFIVLGVLAVLLVLLMLFLVKTK